MPKLEKISCPKMPLAIYREIAAHLEQVVGVRVNVLTQSSRTFDYSQSQVEGLTLDYSENCDRQQIDRILTYYSKCYGAWTRHFNEE